MGQDLNEDSMIDWKKSSLENIHWIKQKCLLFCTSTFFTGFINVSIIFNTICLGLDKYPSDPDLNSLLENINYMLFCIFFIELVVKIIGFGPKIFVKDGYNIFDAIVVSLSIIDIFMHL
jgi:Ion transport protein